MADFGPRKPKKDSRQGFELHTSGCTVNDRNMKNSVLFYNTAYIAIAYGNRISVLLQKNILLKHHCKS
jgi:hypothetical protein